MTERCRGGIFRDESYKRIYTRRRSHSRSDFSGCMVLWVKSQREKGGVTEHKIRRRLGGRIPYSCSRDDEPRSARLTSWVSKAPHQRVP